MTKRLVVAVIAAVAAAGAHGTASAQVFTPTYQEPRLSNDLGIYFSDGPGDFAIEGVLRRNFGGYDLGFRGGIADTEDVSAILGLDLRSPLSLGTQPIDVAFTAGVQGVLGDFDAVGFQGGLTFGHTFTPDAGFTITPYLHPRLALINGFGPDDDFDAELLADLGFDFRLPSGLIFRLGIALGDYGGDWGMGLAWRR